MVLQYNIDFGWEPCALAPDLKTLSGSRVCVSKLSGPYQKPPHRSTVLSLFRIHYVYIFIFKGGKTAVGDSVCTFRIGTGTLDKYLQRGNCLYNKIKINIGEFLRVLFGKTGSRSIRAGLIFFRC